MKNCLTWFKSGTAFLKICNPRSYEQCSTEFKHMESKIMNKLIILLLTLHFHNALMSMEATPQHNLNPSLFDTLPSDIQQEIVSFIKPSQWWYVDKTFKHDEGLNSVCFNPSGTLLATGADDHKARIFDIQTNQEIVSFKHDDYVNSVCFNPSEILLATGADDHK